MRGVKMRQNDVVKTLVDYTWRSRFNDSTTHEALRELPRFLALRWDTGTGSRSRAVECSKTRGRPGRSRRGDDRRGVLLTSQGGAIPAAGGSRRGRPPG